MQTLAPSRRRFLLSTALLGMAGVAVGASRARAFSVEQVNVDTEALAMSACQAAVRPNAYHQQLIDQITAALQGRPQPEINAQLAAAICPICGCPIE